MYQSPISIYETAMQTIMEQRENAIFAKVQDAFDVQVDKAELLRALQYDRNQYEAGYRDGKAEATPKWIPVSERLPEQGQEVIVYSGGVLKPTVFAYQFWNKHYDSWARITHWMPLPEPPKGV